MMNLPWWLYVLTTFTLTHFTIISVTIFLHRHQSHRAIDLHPAISHFFRFWLWLTTGIVTKEWVAIHRKHHANVETDADPHSPQIAGVLNVLFGGLKLYRREAKNTETLNTYGHGTPNDWIEKIIYTKGRYIGILVMLLINIVAFDFFIGMTIWVVQMLWIPFWAAGVINGLGHWGGYRNYELPDASHNLLPLAILIGGEELHNNHHAFPSSAKFSMKSFEFDFGWFYIRLLEFAKLVQINKTPPKLWHRKGRTRCDIETLRAVFANRFDIMSRYTREVLKKVCDDEKKRLKFVQSPQFNIMRRAIKLVQKESRGLNVNGKRHLHAALSLSPKLTISYNAKLALQELWDRSSTNSESLLQQLEEWCNQAECSGIEALEEFALRLKGYRLVDS